MNHERRTEMLGVTGPFLVREGDLEVSQEWWGMPLRQGFGWAHWDAPDFPMSQQDSIEGELS